MPVPDTALVLTAGLGTRLRPLSYVRAKPAVPLVGEAVIRRILRWLKDAGVRNVVLNLHHLPHTIAAQVGDGSDSGITVRYSWEQPILGSAGGPRHALALLPRETFFVVNGDTVTDLDLRELAAAHAQTSAIVSLALTRDREVQRYGGVVIDQGGAVTAFVPRGTDGSAGHFIGVQVVHRSAFGDLRDGVPAESFGGVFQRLMASRPGSVRGFVCEAGFWDLGTPQDYLNATLAIARRDGVAQLPVGRRSIVAASSHLVDTIVWDDVTIGEHCELDRCIIADGATIPAESRFVNTAIVPALGRPPSGSEWLSGDLLMARITDHVE